jgi:hypothetical protein
MNYCRLCKIPGKLGETTCAKCGGPLASFGGAAAGAKTAPRAAASPALPAGSSRPAGAPTTAARPAGATFQDGRAASADFLSLGGQIEEAERIVRTNVARGRVFSLLSLAALLAILFVLYQVYSYTVGDYARLSDVVIQQDAMNQHTLRISYNADSTGKVSFFRDSGPYRTEVIKIIKKPGRDGETWTWPADPQAGIDCCVRYRSLLLPAWTTNHFEVEPRADVIR